jgi:hypothetical protein
MSSSYTLQQFVAHHRVRLNRDECHDAIVRGKLGHLYEHAAGQFGIVLEAQANSASLDTTLRVRRRRAIAAGFFLHQEGDSEAILLFDSDDAKQSALAIRLIHAKRIRQAAPPTDAQLRARAAFSSKARSSRPCFNPDTNAPVGHGGRHSSGSPGKRTIGSSEESE